MTQNLIVLTNLPDQPAANALAEHLIAQRLAACINILAPCTSVYRWQGGIEHSTEVPMLIKTTSTRYPALEAAIVDAHPYELPEIVAVPIELGLAAYLGWIDKQTAPDAPAL